MERIWNECGASAERGRVNVGTTSVQPRDKVGTTIKHFRRETLCFAAFCTLKPKPKSDKRLVTNIVIYSCIIICLTRFFKVFISAVYQFCYSVFLTGW